MTTAKHMNGTEKLTAIEERLANVLSHNEKLLKLIDAASEDAPRLQLIVKPPTQNLAFWQMALSFVLGAWATSVGVAAAQRV